MAKTPFGGAVTGFGLGKPDIDFNVDFSNATWNTLGAHQILAVTGLVRIKLIIYFATAITSVSTYTDIKLGIPSNDDELRTYINAESISAGEFWAYSGSGSGYKTIYSSKDYNNTGTNQAILKEPLMDFVCGGEDIEYSLTNVAPTAGTINVIAWYQALSSGATVVQGDGS